MADANTEWPFRVPGKWVVIAIFVGSFAGAWLAVYLVRPTPGAHPADVADRPFGPAASGERNDAPLIYRRSDGD